MVEICTASTFRARVREGKENNRGGQTDHPPFVRHGKCQVLVRTICFVPSPAEEPNWTVLPRLESFRSDVYSVSRLS